MAIAGGRNTSNDVPISPNGTRDQSISPGVSQDSFDEGDIPKFVMVDILLPFVPLKAPRRSSNVIIKGGKIKVGLFVSTSKSENPHDNTINTRGREKGERGKVKRRKMRGKSSIIEWATVF